MLSGAGRHPDRTALIDGTTGRSLSYGQLHRQVHSLAGGMQAWGVTSGTVVGLMAPNIPEYAVVFHAVAVAGGAVTTINPTCTAGEVRAQLTDSGARLLVTTQDFHATATAAANGTDVRQIVTIDGDGSPDQTSLTGLFGEPIEQVPVDPTRHVVALPYSSGTTGLPKGVMLTHRNLVANLAQTRAVLSYSDDREVALAVLPFFHIYGMQVLMNNLLEAGVTVVTMPRFDLAVALDLIQRQRVTRFFAVPPIVLALAKHPLVADYDLSSLRQVLSGAAPLSAELAQEASRRIGCEVVQGFGMTELSPVSHGTPPGDFRPGSSGVALPHTESRIVDPATGDDLPDGHVGELLIRGPQVMQGYLGNPEATAETIDQDGWLHTGDLARIDDGHLYVVDRLKELIKVKGFQVAPAEVEAVLLDHPDVADAAVVAIPDDEAGELPIAYVVPTPGTELDPDQIRRYVDQRVAAYKRLTCVIPTDAIPKSASGKVLRRVLRDRLNLAAP